MKNAMISYWARHWDWQFSRIVLTVFALRHYGAGNWASVAIVIGIETCGAAVEEARVFWLARKQQA
jgi:hypothetical protein